MYILQRIDGDPHGAAAVSVVLLSISFIVCCSSAGCGTSRRGTSMGKWVIRVVALGYLLIVLLGPLGMMIFRTLQDWDAAWARSRTPPPSRRSSSRCS